MWNKKQIEQHKKAADNLAKIVKEFSIYIKNNQHITEYEAAVFVKKLFRKYNLKSDKTNPIVAFRENTSFVHYYPEQKSLKLKPESLILFDLWGRVNAKGAPYADITWMLYFGKKVPKDVEKVFLAVIDTRDEAIKFIKKNLSKRNIPMGKEIDKHVRDYLHKYKLADKFLHGTGHSLGFTYAHGNKTRISPKGKQSLPINVGYTIEPGVYFKNKFGVRSEIDFYIDNNYTLVITGAVQQKIIII
jgi:Xaa-Pro aminopeptidase